MAVGEKGNLVETGEKVLAGLVEQTPQDVLAYKEYVATRPGRSPAHAADSEADAQDSATHYPASPAAE
jgi:hypothetical protein